jgi:glycosyltransferase involved in cell wall biosynthesis
MPARRVVYLLKRFPRLSETFVLNEVLELRRQGLELSLYALMDPQEPLVHPEAANLVGEVVYLHDVAQPLRSWWRLLIGAAAQAVSCPGGAARVAWCWLGRHRSRASLRHAVEGLWLARVLRRDGVAHLHAHFAHSPAAVAHMANLAGGPPFSFTAHAKDLYTTAARHVADRSRAAAFVVTCTEANRRYLASFDGAAAQVVYHGVDTARFHPRGRCSEAGRILSVGRLVPKKGFEVLIDALQILAAQGVRFECEIIGDGPLRDALGRRIDDYGLDELVRLRGALLQDQVLDAYRRAAVFVLAPLMTGDGDRDGIPNVLVEAMACEVPVVSTRLSGIPELVSDGAEGVLVEPGDAVRLAEAIKLMLSDETRAASLATAGRRKVEDKFDLHRNTRRLVELFAPLPAPVAHGELVAVP